MARGSGTARAGQCGCRGPFATQTDLLSLTTRRGFSSITEIDKSLSFGTRFHFDLIATSASEIPLEQSDVDDYPLHTGAYT